jgi:hypothetical protein
LEDVVGGTVMKVEILKVIGDWSDVKESARNTIGMNGAGKEPDSDWKIKMLACEHSPIRAIKIRWKWTDLPSWVSVHFVRHKIGCEHWVTTQRTDRVKTGVDRGESPQSTPVTHIMEADLQSIINISKVRLCNGASPETRQAWQMFLNELAEIEPEVVALCVPTCVYRGFCPEFYKCGYENTSTFIKHWKTYYGLIQKVHRKDGQ